MTTKETGQVTVDAQQGTVERVGAFRLKPTFSERVWGRRSLAPWYGETGTEEPVGEAWLTGPQSEVETGPLKGKHLGAAVSAEHDAILGEKNAEEEFPLLVKMLFPDDKLSVQVHPNDAEAQAMGQARGKTECWYVLEAEPGATVALGLKEGSTLDGVRDAIAAGTLEEMMHMEPVQRGDMVFVDAGTVHAIGPGLVLLETQQTCDVTYRMFDYGRPRELHVEQGLGVTKLRTRAGKVAPRAMNGYVRLIEEHYFSVDRFEGPATVRMDGPGCLVGLAPGLRLSEDGASLEMPMGEAIVVPAGATVTVDGPAGAAYLRCVAPEVPMTVSTEAMPEAAV